MDIIIENSRLRLTVGSDCIVKSLINKNNGEECLALDQEISLFSVTQKRPYNNEVKLVYCNKHTTYQANRLRREGDCLIIGFDIAPYEAVVQIKEAPDYISFTLKDFIVHPTDYDYLMFSPPPVEEFRLLQLPIRHRKQFGEWLNVCWDDTTAVNVLSTSAHARIDSEKRKDCRILTADAVRDVKLHGCGAALIVSDTDKLLDCVASVEEDYDLPRGVKSRRDPILNASIYWTGNITPQNVDEHIRYAKAGGFRLMLIYYKALFREEVFYTSLGDYDYKSEYPNGAADLKAMLDKIRAAGITPGFHILHTHIGIKSRYVTPVADPRLNLTRHFTLAKPLGKDDTVIYVQQDPTNTVMHERCRVLKFDGELIYYDSYSNEYPYCFTGCKRGHFDTYVTEHAAGTIGGILDISEFGANSVYLDQHSDLQDEIAAKIGEAYNCGFGFVYFDGSEGTNPPFEFHVPNAQHRIYKSFNKAPLFCEGAAKSHFGWHMLSGANAFDVFPTNVFKEKIVEFPVHAAQHMRGSFTRVNFGWWSFRKDTQPDIFEFGTSRAAAWDCPATMQAKGNNFQDNPRTDDILEVMRRWEDVRAKNWLTDAQKEMLKDKVQEHTLLINEDGEYELVPYTQIKSCSEDIRAFFFERKSKNYIVCWHATGCGKLKLALPAEQVCYEKEPGGEAVSFECGMNEITIPVAGKSYLSTVLPKEVFLEIFQNAQLI